MMYDLGVSAGDTTVPGSFMELVVPILGYCWVTLVDSVLDGVYCIVPLFLF